MEKKQQIQANQERILDAMLDKDYSGLSNLIHPDASVFGTALHEIEYGFLNVQNYYIKSLGQLPDEMFIHTKWKRYTDLDDLALVEQEYTIEFLIEGEKVVLPSMRQSTLWKSVHDTPAGPERWLLLHDHTSLPDQSGDDETLPINHLIRRNIELETEVARRTSELEVMVRQLKVEAALNRVVAKVASMRTSSDLQLIIPLIWKELNELKVPFIRCGVFIFDEANEMVRMYLSTPSGKALATTEFPFNEMSIVRNAINSWQSDKIYLEHWEIDDFKIWAAFLVNHGLIESVESYFNNKDIPTSLDLHFVPFEQGMMYVGSPGVLTEDQLKTARALADSFAVAYARYEDFRKLELNYINLSQALEELKAAQNQLVQQEKLASLGQLTAGIAHEIKNPLNFVNNFSEVGLEMIDEALEELQKIGENEHAAETAAILADIKSNLAKIHEHGSRADGIVKSMLMHSRGGNGKMEPTDLNALVKEYVNLSYHGMRAGKDSIEANIDLQLDEAVGEVPLIAEDLSRVVLNLCNNAFDACAERSRSAMREKSETGNDNDNGKGQGQGQGDKAEEYSPKLTVRTHQNDKTVTIEVEDNGTGIPDDIKDKILQPFFTTKKGTQGTGLGLSITNDIIKAHGGTLEIESEPGRTVFNITLSESSHS